MVGKFGSLGEEEVGKKATLGVQEPTHTHTNILLGTASTASPPNIAFNNLTHWSHTICSD